MIGEKIEIDSGRKYLRRLEVFLDVAFALLFFQILQYLPQGEGMEWAGQPWGILRLFFDDPVEVLRIFIGLGLTLIYWNQSNRTLSPLVQTNGRHAMIMILQLIFVCLFVYFAIMDPRLSGGPSSPALQSLSLSIAGFLGVAGWVYARKHRFIHDGMDEDEKNKIYYKSFLEPVTALLNTPLAFVAPLVWTLGWLVLPFLVWGIIRWISR